MAEASLGAPVPCYGLRGKGTVRMISIFFKIALLAVLMILTVGAFPDRRKSWIVAIGTCIAGAVILHFVAP